MMVLNKYELQLYQHYSLPTLKLCCKYAISSIYN